MEKNIAYQHINTYSTLNTLTEKTKNIWWVCHGMGYLSRYFIRHFSELDPVENYIIAPQAPSKYYQSNDFKHVGASWLTKDNTKQETENILAYLNAVYEAEQLPENVKFIGLGFSQGVSIITRWLAKRQIRCEALILYAGGIPVELVKENFIFLREQQTKVWLVYGTEDQYLNENRLKKENEKAILLFGNQINRYTFEGGHEMKKEVINHLI